MNLRTSVGFDMPYVSPAGPQSWLQKDRLPKDILTALPNPPRMS